MKNFYSVTASILASIVSKTVSLLILILITTTVNGATLKMAIEEPITSLNPFTLSSGVGAWKISRYILETLADENLATGEMRPRLATKWEISEDKTRFHFWLRKDVKWHDGIAFTAKDVQFSLRALKEPSLGGTRWGSFFKQIDRIEIINKHELIVHTKTPEYSNWLSVIRTLRVLPAHGYQDRVRQDWSGKLIGTGPYKISDFKKGHLLSLSKNPTWWGKELGGYRELYHYKNIAFIPVSGLSVASQLIKKSKLDVFPLTDISEFNKAKNVAKGVRIHHNRAANMGSLMGIRLNLEHPLFTNINVRKALNYLWDREFINKKVFDSQLFLARSVWPQKVPFSISTSDFEYSPKTAKVLLSKSGWTSLSSNKWLTKGAQEFKFAVLYDQKSLEKALSFYVKDAEKLGIKVELKYVHPRSSWKLLKSGRYQAYARQRPIHPDVISSTLRTNSEYNDSNYSNETVDKLLDDLDKSFDWTKRNQIRKRIYSLVTKDVIEVYGFESPVKHFAISRRLKKPKGPVFLSELFEKWEIQ